MALPTYTLTVLVTGRPGKTMTVHYSFASEQDREMAANSVTIADGLSVVSKGRASVVSYSEAMVEMTTLRAEMRKL